MTFYYFQEEMGGFLNDILKKLLFKSNNHSLSEIAVTWINYKVTNSTIKGFGCGINNNLQIYRFS